MTGGRMSDRLDPVAIAAFIDRAERYALNEPSLARLARPHRRRLLMWAWRWRQSHPRGNAAADKGRDYARFVHRPKGEDQ